MSREQALHFLDNKTGPLKKALIVGLPMTPVTVAILQSFALWRSGIDLTPSAYVPGQVFWTPLMWVIIAVSTGLLWRRAKKQIAQFRPIIEAGNETPGKVQSSAQKESQSKGVTMFTLEAQVALSDGRNMLASITEPVGTPLPVVAVGEPATAWVYQGQAVVGVREGLLMAKRL